MVKQFRPRQSGRFLPEPLIEVKLHEAYGLDEIGAIRGCNLLGREPKIYSHDRVGQPTNHGITSDTSRQLAPAINVQPWQNSPELPSTWQASWDGLGDELLDIIRSCPLSKTAFSTDDDSNTEVGCVTTAVVTRHQPRSLPSVVPIHLLTNRSSTRLRRSWSV